MNVVKYKLDLMRKRLETEERDATSRASFKCTNCLKTFTDLEVSNRNSTRSRHIGDSYDGLSFFAGRPAVRHEYRRVQMHVLSGGRRGGSVGIAQERFTSVAREIQRAARATLYSLARSRRNQIGAGNFGA